MENNDLLITEEERNRILKSFFKDNKIEQMPSQLKKKLVVLEEIAKIIEPNKKYSEFELNMKLKPICADFCTLRRDLVDNGFLTRDNGIYEKVIK